MSPTLTAAPHGVVDLTDLLGYSVVEDEDDDPVLIDRDGEPVDTRRDGYPYDQQLPRSVYDPAKRALQIEMLKLQRWLKDTGGRLVVLFEGRDAAGKGGTIKRFTEHLNPRFDYADRDDTVVGRPDKRIVGRRRWSTRRASGRSAAPARLPGHAERPIRAAAPARNGRNRPPTAGEASLREGSGGAVEHRGDRAVLEHLVDRAGDQRRDRQHLEPREALPGRDRQGVGDDHPVDDVRREALDGRLEEDRVGRRDDHAGRP